MKITFCILFAACIAFVGCEKKDDGTKAIEKAVEKVGTNVPPAK